MKGSGNALAVLHVGQQADLDITGYGIRPETLCSQAHIRLHFLAVVSRHLHYLTLPQLPGITVSSVSVLAMNSD
jgi:hypothetical protein